ncbi:CapA family protein [Bacillus sp. AFS040349]|uniref:CapA family protein n=1 Tax=Bacillus sp. AFS040349 TaxID=2033502 RepID=UPI000BFC6FB3|nr:CapA family protein [Bacillus sp. AFS040349]PGT77851.1 capsular biosynthesis protein [Bacillus sp. AFS040349]
MDEKKASLSRVTNRRKRRRLKKVYRRILLGIIFIIIVSSAYSLLKPEKSAVVTTSEHEGKESVISEKQLVEVPSDVDASIKISAAGDFTLGMDENFEYNGSFVHTASTNGLSYFLEGLNDVFKKDDLTTVNLETTLTNATEKAEKTFRFKGDPEYAQILKLGGIEAVNLANNHIFDYKQKGYEDTIEALKERDVGYFGYENQFITTIKEVKIGALGYEGWEDTEEIRSTIEKDIQSLREQGVQIVLIHFHWGDEKHYVPNEDQKSLARFSVDAGADLILGHHPHVLQGIEEYNGKFIVYSLGNFMFGGNKNPSDKDTFVFQQTFHIENGELSDKKEINVVPFSISSVSSHNDYQPTLLSGGEYERVKDKIIHYSNQVKGSDWIVYDTEEEVTE